MDEEKKEGGQVMAKVGTNFMKIIGQIRRSPEKQACIDQAIGGGASKRDARKSCRKTYGSGIGNFGRSLGLTGTRESRIQARPIFPAFNKSNGAMMSPGDMMAGSYGNTRTAGSFSWWYILPVLLFLPAVRKLIFK